MADNISTTACSKVASEKYDEFPLFSSFPVELQCRIFKEAFPDPEIIYWNFHIQLAQTEEESSNISMGIYNHYGLLSLLLACKNSHAEVFRNYEKIEINLPTSLELRTYRNSDRYRYLRKTVDILRTNFLGFIALYDVGGSMKLDNITHLALNVDFEYGSDELYMRVLAKFYISLSTRCPALNTLKFIYDGSIGVDNMYTPDSSQCLDISEGCMDLDWDFTSLKQFLMEFSTSRIDPGYYFQMEGVFECLIKIDMKAKKLLKNFDRFLNTTEKDAWDKPGEETLKYWKRIRPTPVLLVIYACQDHFRSSSPCSCMHENLEVFIDKYELFLRVRKDGTPLHKYTGLRQIFEGEPW